VTKLVDSYGAIYNKPGKGHDRLLIFEDEAFFGTLDGAGGDELSSAIVREIHGSLSSHIGLRDPSLPNFMAHVVSDMDSLPEGERRKSTAALCCLAERSSEIEVAYLNAGDSSIYLYDRGKDELSQIAHSPTEIRSKRGRHYINTDEFLGANRSPMELNSIMGRLLLPKIAEWSIIAMSDGVIDDDGRGIPYNTLKEIVKYSTTCEVPSDILSSYYPYDDASVVVIQR
jgi:hypothetical protein